MTHAAEKMTPGDLVIQRFGSPRKVELALALILECPPTYRAINNWKGGLVPSRYQKSLLDAAKRISIKLTHKELIEGGCP